MKVLNNNTKFTTGFGTTAGTAPICSLRMELGGVSLIMLSYCFGPVYYWALGEVTLSLVQDLEEQNWKSFPPNQVDLDSTKWVAV